MPRERGPYRFAILPVDVSPEHHAAVISLGSDITDEQFDVLGDIDEFTLSGPPGSSGSVFLTVSFALANVDAEVIDAVSRVVLAKVTSFVAREGPANFTFPPGGTVKVRVSEPNVGLGFHLVGPYRLEVYSNPP